MYTSTMVSRAALAAAAVAGVAAVTTTTSRATTSRAVRTGRLVSCGSWDEAREAIRLRHISGAIVRGAFRDVALWDSTVPSGDVISVSSAASQGDARLGDLAQICAMFEDGASALQAAESLGNAVDEFRRCFVDAEDHRSEVRVRATISSGGAPCPKLHTDDIVLRCVVAFAGPATVVAPFAKPPSRLQRLVPASIALPALFSSPADDAEVSPELGDALLMKGSRWGPGHAPILHRSPMPTDAKRILVSFDRLCDVQSLGA